MHIWTFTCQIGQIVTMSKRMVIIVPTRSAGGIRVLTLDRLIESWEKTRVSSDMIVGIDDDEWEIYPKKEHPNLYYRSYSRTGYCDKLNSMCRSIAADDYNTSDRYDIIGHLSDDHVFTNDMWDELIPDWIEHRGMGVCYGNDLLQGENLPTAPFISWNIIKALGFMCPPGLKHMFVDNFWKDLGIRLDCLKYFPEIITEHMHWSNGKTIQDAQYKEVNDLMQSDWKAFDEYRANQMDADIQRVKEQLNF